MNTANQKFEDIEEKLFINDRQEERQINKNTQITSNTHEYEYQMSTKMDEENKRKRKWSTQFAPQKYHQNNLPSYKHLTYKYRNDNKNRLYYKNKTYNYLKSKQSSQEREFKNEDYIKIKKYNLVNTNINNIEQEYHDAIITVESQKKKTPITLINEWAMRGDGSCGKKPYVVYYSLVAITGHAHKPIFTYMCQVNDKTAKGEGKSKKEAKQNAAARMWEKLFEVNSTTNNDKVITSTTITDNFDVNENDTSNLTSTEGSQIIDEMDSNMEDEELQHSKYELVKIAHCNMNPIGALQELSTTYRWTPPFYNFQKLGPLNKDQQQNGVYKTLSYKVTCKVFHLQTTGTASTKKEAKRLAARLMFDQINDIGADKLNTLKSLESENVNYKKDCEMEQEETRELPLEWKSALLLRSYIKTTVAEAVNTITESSPSHFLFESDKIQEEKLKIKKEYQMELEHSILQFNSNLSAVDQLQTLSQQLNFQVMYICVNDMDVQQQQTVKSGQDGEFTILIQVTTEPVIAAMGRENSIYKAAEVAATSVLHLLKNMLIYTKNQNNDEQDNTICPIFTFL